MRGADINKVAKILRSDFSTFSVHVTWASYFSCAPALQYRADQLTFTLSPAFSPQVTPTKLPPPFMFLPFLNYRIDAVIEVLLRSNTEPILPEIQTSSL